MILSLDPLHEETKAQATLHKLPKLVKLLDGRAMIGTQVCIEIIQTKQRNISHPT